MRAKVKLLFTRLEGVKDASIDEALRAESNELDRRFPGRLSHCRAYLVQDEALERTAAGAFDAADHPFDAMWEVAIESDESLDVLIPLLSGLSARLHPLVDPTRSAALAGTEHIILPGDGPLLVLITNRRLPHFTHDGFIQYWLDYHGPFAREHTPPEVGLRYRQFHTDENATENLLAATGLAIGDFDGAAECYYLNADAVGDLMGRAEIVDEATEDEKEFVDHERCVTSVLAITSDSTGHRAA